MATIPELNRRPGDTDEIRVGISSCLLGEKVRFDGGHKEDRFLSHTLAQFWRFVPVCPELDLGLGTPRESLRLIAGPGNPRLVAPKSGTDHTDAMEEYARAKIAELRALELSGYILKRSSPSCGMERVRVYGAQGIPERNGRGVFARILLEEMPNLPVEEEGRLSDPGIRENFIERVFAHDRLTRFFRTDWRVGDLVRFHTAEKYLLLAHEPQQYTFLGRLVAGAKDLPRNEVEAAYTGAYFAAMTKFATRAKHVNVLQHLLGYLREPAPERARQELARTVEEYRQGLLPLVVPITLVRHYVHVFGIDYLAGQTYLEPHPRELQLRNHV